jgi:hypothetical protein
MPKLMGSYFQSLLINRIQEATDPEILEILSSHSN